MSHYEEDEFVTEWDVFAGEEEEDFEEDEEDQGSFLQDSFSVGTDGSPVDVMGFPMTPETTTTNKGRSSKLERRIGKDVDVSSTHEPRQRRNVSRLPRKSRSLDDTGKASVSAAATHGNLQHISRGGRRKGSSVGGGSLASSSSEERRRGPRERVRRSVTSEGKPPRERVRRSVTADNKDSRSSSGGAESAAERIAKMKNLAAAYHGAKVLEKSFVAKTDHLKKDPLM